MTGKKEDDRNNLVSFFAGFEKDNINKVMNVLILTQQMKQK